jgi:hypothetical protein
MLISIVRRLFSELFSIESLSEEDCLNVIRTLKLDKLPSSYVFLLNSLIPIASLIIKKLQNESVSFDKLLDID